MAYALINSSGERDYHDAVLRFLESIEDAEVHGVVMVAVCSDGPYLSWAATPMELAVAASVLQAQVVKDYIELEDDGDDEKDCFGDEWDCG